MTKILVFGKNGQLATALAQACQNSNFTPSFFGHSEFNLINKVHDIKDFIANFDSIDYVINTSAYTDVDSAENTGSEDAWALNALAPYHMAQACCERSIPFIHVSTESVFDGQKNTAYLPKDKTNPVNFYGLTKLIGENLIQKAGGQNIVFRTSWVFSEAGKNFVKSIHKAATNNTTIKVVDDQIGLPTYAPDLASAILTAAKFMLENPSHTLDPVYHIAGGGSPINRYDFAKLIVKISSLNTRVLPVSSDQFAAPAPRPENAVLDSSSFTSTFNIDLPNSDLPDWQIGLKYMLSKMG